VLQYLPALISFLSAVLSFVFFLLNFRLSRKLSDRSTTIEAHKLLLDIDKQLISDPRLWALQDNHPVAAALREEPADPLLAGKLDAFAYLVLNTFEILLAVHPGARDKRGNAEYETWRRFVHNTLKSSAALRRTLESPAMSGLYGAELLAEHERAKVSLGADA
jgi:hypothetical protein